MIANRINLRLRADRLPSGGKVRGAFLAAGRAGPIAALVLLAACGCRLPSWEGPVPRSLAASRQLSQRGINALERGDWEKAESLLNRAVEICPDDPDARRQYAETLWHRGAKAEALTQLHESIRHSSSDPALLVRAAEMELALGQTNEARRDVERAIDLDAKAPAAWAFRARLMRHLGQTRQALADYHRALGYDRSNPDILLEIAELHRALDQPQKALTALQALVDTYPVGEEPQRVLYLEGLAYMALRRFDDAVESFAAAARRDKPTAEILCGLGEAELASGRPGDARQALGQALTLDPNHAPSRAAWQQVELAQRASVTR
jgi:tetratricopeptide (TPR) repeat protein